MVGGKSPIRLSTQALILGWIALLAVLFINAVRRVDGPTGDFVHFYEAARAMVHGEDIYSSGLGGYIYPPLLAFLYTPLALLSSASAAVVLLVCNMVLMLLCVLLATRELASRFGIVAHLRTTGAVAFVAVLLTADKLKGELQMWQTNLLMLFLFTAALRLLDRWPALSGAALGMAFNIKYLPIVVLPYLLLRRRWTAAGSFVVSAAGFALLPAVLTGWDVNLRYQAVAYSGLLRLMGAPVGSARAANIENISAVFSVSIPSAIARLTGAGGFTGLALPAAGLVALAALAAAAWIYRRNGVPLLYRPDGARPGDPPTRAVVGLEWAGLITAGLVFSPQTNTRHLCLLLFPFTLAALLLLRPRKGMTRLARTDRDDSAGVRPRPAAGRPGLRYSGGRLVRRAPGRMAHDRRAVLVRLGDVRLIALDGSAVRAFTGGGAGLQGNAVRGEAESRVTRLLLRKLRQGAPLKVGSRLWPPSPLAGEGWGGGWSL